MKIDCFRIYISFLLSDKSSDFASCPTDVRDLLVLKCQMKSGLRGSVRRPLQLTQSSWIRIHLKPGIFLSPLRLPMRLELYNGNILGDEFGPSFPYNVAITKKGIASPKESHNAIRHHRHSVTCNLKMADFRYDIQKLSAETEKKSLCITTAFE